MKDRPAESGPGALLPPAADLVFRGAGLGAGDRVACGGFAERADVSALGAAGVTARTIRRSRGRGVCFRSRCDLERLLTRFWLNLARIAALSLRRPLQQAI